MSILKRYPLHGSPVFITNITFHRQPIINKHYSILSDVIRKMSIKLSFDLIAHVFLDDHFHVLINPRINSISEIMHRIKLSFGNYYRRSEKLQSGQIWQRRFYDHIIRNQKDFNHHLDYIHYNPVKHKYVTNPQEWEYSSFLDFVVKGYYNRDWMISENEFDGDYGE